MRTQLKLLASFLLACFLFSLTGCKSYRNIDGDFVAANVELNLDVDAAALFNSGEINNKEFVESRCTLTETIDGKVIKRKKGKLKSFKTDVVANDDMTWDVTTDDEGYSAKIINITPVLKGSRDRNFFPRYILEADITEVIDKVLVGRRGKRYPYIIFFSVTREEDNQTKEFFVDPKLMGVN